MDYKERRVVKRKAVREFRKLYVPPLVKARDSRAMHIARTQNAHSSPKKTTLNKRPDHHELSVRGGRARWAKLDPQERRKQLLAHADKLHAAMAKKPKAVISALNSAHAKSSWDKLTPEQREARLVKTRASLAMANAKLLAARPPVWPFPIGPRARQLYGDEFKAAMREARERAERMRRFAAGTKK